MTDNLSQEINDMDDEIALPRKNGELQFEQPWEARAFGLAVALNGEGVYPWKNFSEGLAAEIGRAESTDATAEEADSTYYERWYRTLEKLVIEKGLISADELEARAVTQAKYDNHEIDSLDG